MDKPAGMTSHDVVAVVRRAARSKRVGHAGTLDPFATDLLVIAVGPCTRLLPYVVGEPKVYDAEIRFGHETDTDDSTGSITTVRDVPAFTAQSLHAALATLTGPIAQVPPVYSAKHVDGKRAYALARRGDAVVLPPVTVTVHAWDVLEVGNPYLRARITCAGGTYVRALARDLGRALDTAAHCGTLRRIASGPASVASAVVLSDLTPGAIADGSVALQSPLPALGDIAHEPLDAEGIRDLSHGRSLLARRPGALAALLYGDAVVGIAQRTADDRWQPRVVLLDGVAA